MKISIVGNGIIGGALRQYVQAHTPHEILIYDPPQGYTAPIHKADIVFISVPVITKGFKQDLTILRLVLELCPKNVPIFIRSSVLPGTTDMLKKEFDLHLFAFPEFLTERTAIEDFTRAEKHLIGLPFGIIADYNISQILDEALPHKKFNLVDNSVAEMVKFAHNCYAATKVTFFNGIYDLCKKQNINYDHVKEHVPKVTGFISPVHMEVPGPDSKRGFGGACFPSNLAALMGHVGNDAFYMLLEKVWTLNCVYRGDTKFPNVGEK